MYGVTDQSGRVLEIRRLDGVPFPAHGSLVERKSHAIKGSQKDWPVGVLEAAACDFLAIAEGLPDFLALHQYVVQEDAVGKVGPVGLLSASCRIIEDALAHFKGKHVRIFPHLDEAGNQRNQGPESYEKLAKYFVQQALELQPGEILTLTDAFQSFSQFLKRKEMDPIKRPFFKGMVIPIVREEFNVSLRNDLRGRSSPKQMCGWKDLRALDLDSLVKNN